MSVATLAGQILAEVTATVGEATTLIVCENGVEGPLLLEHANVIVFVPAVAYEHSKHLQ